MKTKIVTFGEILLRISKPGYQRLFQGHHMFGNYGGSEANAAISLAYLGDNVEYVTRVPYGEMGEAALMHLREYGLNVSHVVRGGERLGTYYFEEAVAMRNSRVVYDRKNSSFYTLKRGMVKWERCWLMLPYSIAPALPVLSAAMRWNQLWMPSNLLFLTG